MQLNPKSCLYPVHLLILREFFFCFHFSFDQQGNFSETITEEKVRSLLLRKPITFTELIQMFLPRGENIRTKEVKDGIVRQLAAVLKRLNIEEKTINGKKHIRLKST